MVIQDTNQMRAASVTLTAAVNAMCNAKNTQDISEEFIKAKDTLIALFKFKVESVTI